MKTFLTLLLAVVPLVSFAQPIIRNPATTNRFMNLPSNLTVPFWNAAAGRWSNSTVSAGSDAGGTNSRQGGTLAGTNLVNNPNVVTNILGAGTVTVTSNNAGTFTITGSDGGTNTLVQTNGVNLGSAGTINFSPGVTGYLAGAVANLGVNVAVGAGGDQVWTNDNESFRPVLPAGFPSDFSITPSNFLDRPTIFIGGTGASNWINNIFGPDPGFSIASVRVHEDGYLPYNHLLIASPDNVFGDRYGHAVLYTGTNSAYFESEFLDDGGYQRFSAGAFGPGQVKIVLMTNGIIAFNVDGAGGISKMKGVTQNWPGSQGAAKTVLTNDGSGNLGWSANLSTANLSITGTTNHITFGATNAPPVSAVAPTKWVSVLINGEATQYKIPLYQ